MSTFLYRPVRGGLDESMKEKKELGSTAELVAAIEDHWNNKVASLFVKPYGFDVRINWDTYIVMVKFARGIHEFVPVGYTNAPVCTYVMPVSIKPDG